MKNYTSQFPVEEVSAKLDVKFKNADLLKTAFTHAAYANVFKTTSNQRMEFLGDSVLGLVVSDYVYRNSKLNEGDLTRIKSQFVSEEALSKVVDGLEVNTYLLVNQGSLGQALHEKPSVKADLYESIVAAIYLDSGLEVAREFVLRTLNLGEKAVKQYLEDSLDYKTQLQELLQKEGKVKITYRTTLTKGSAHEPVFTAWLTINGEKVAKATGSSKRKSEQEAAKLALEKYKK